MKKYILFFLLAFLSLVTLLSVHWGVSYFANLKMEEIIYELRAPLKGSEGVISNYLIHCLLPASIITCLLILCLRFYRRFIKAVTVIFFILLFGSVAYFSFRVDAVHYFSTQLSGSDFIEKNYVDPKDVSITFPGKRRNLIFIYLESMETTFSDFSNGGAFNENYIPELSLLAQENEDFSGEEKTMNGGYSMPGATWTIAGMFATSSGLPLKIGLSDNAMSTQEHFFPNIVTLGDLLESAGYRQVFQLGSDVTFGGRKVLMTDHGHFEFRDYYYAIEHNLISPDYLVYWGYEDEKLFSFSRETLTELAAGDQPFNFTMITVDTHNPEGYKCRLCKDEYNLPYKNILSCSSKQVYDFIKWIQEQPFYSDTTIVITGDHTTKAVAICDDIDPDYLRKTYTCIINPACSNSENKKRSFTTFDIFPTTLAALGVNIDGERLGLGTNLFSSSPTLSEVYGFETESEEIMKKSEFLSELEKIDSKSQQVIDLFKNVEPAEMISFNKGDRLISVVSSDMSDYADLIEHIKVKFWYYDGPNYISPSVTLKHYNEGDKLIYKGEMDTELFTKIDEVHYQFYVKTPETGFVELGKEGIVTAES